MRLMRFVCSFAWADLRVQDEERLFVRDMITRLQLDPDEIAQVEAWLEVPPPAEEVDPSEIPRAHRRLFLDTVRQLAEADGTIDLEEDTSLSLLVALLDV
jgi:tellurite resistance protein